MLWERTYLLLNVVNFTEFAHRHMLCECMLAWPVYFHIIQSSAGFVRQTKVLLAFFFVRKALLAYSVTHTLTQQEFVMQS